MINYPPDKFSFKPGPANSELEPISLLEPGALPTPGNALLEPNNSLLAPWILRGEIWRGYDQVTAQSTQAQGLDTGFANLNQALLHDGWPLASLIEICQKNVGAGAWVLLTPALIKLHSGFVVLLNPPFEPFVPGLIKAGLDLEQLLIVRTRNKADFLYSFVELARADACECILAWQPKEALSYAELRKCLLASSEGKGLYVLLRPLVVAQQSSPARLRLTMDIQANYLQLNIFKQKGQLKPGDETIKLPLPDFWNGYLPFHLLHQSGQEEKQAPRPATIIPLRRG